MGLCFLDGHPDFLDGTASEAGETAEMELAVLSGSGAAPLVGLAGSTPMVPVERVALLGHCTQDLDDDAAGEVARLHLDLDVLDPHALPAVTYPQPGGPGWEQLALALEPLARSPTYVS